MLPMQMGMIVVGILAGGGLGLFIFSVGASKANEKAHGGIGCVALLIAAAVAGLFFKLSGDYAGSTVYVVNHLGKTMVVSIGEKQTVLVPKGGFESVVVPNGETKIETETEKGTKVESFRENLKPKEVYLYKVKGVGSTVLFDMSGIYLSDEKEKWKFDLKRKKGKFETLGNFYGSKLIPPGKKLPKEVRAGTKVFAFRHAPERSNAEWLKHMKYELTVLSSN